MDAHQRFIRRIARHDRAGFGVFLAFLLIPLSGIGTDIYLPSMPSMASALGASAAQIQLTLTLTLFIAGYGRGQLVVGVLLDRFGRWRPMLVALALFAASSALIAVSDDLRVIWALRLLQGLLGAVVVVSKRTFFVDVFRGAALQRYLTWMTVVWSLGPICAPFVGGFVQTHWGWRTNFVLLRSLPCWRWRWSWPVAAKRWPSRSRLPRARCRPARARSWAMRPSCAACCA